MNNAVIILKKFNFYFLIYIFFFFFSFSAYAYASTYYVDSSITDTNISSSIPDCTNYNPATYLCSGGTASAYKTLSDINAKSYSPGDSILFKKGDTFYGSITVSQSGTSGNPITFSSYGTGAQPIITGFTDVISWTNLGNNIWESTNAVSTLDTVNMVTVSGTNTAMGRYPNFDAANGGYLKVDSTTASTNLTSSSLTGTPNWTGAEVVTHGGHFLMGRSAITSQSGSTLNFNAISQGGPSVDFGFFIQGDSRTLDQQNEWYYNPISHKIQMYSASQPVNVKVSSVTKLITIQSNYLIFDDISFTGANELAFYAWDHTPRYNNVTITNSSFFYMGVSAIYTLINYLDIENNIILESNGSAISVTYGANVTIKNNDVRNIGLKHGMKTNIYSGNNNSAVEASISPNLIIESNIIKNTGYNAIAFYGDNILVKNNYIDTYCVLLDDGGGIYTFTGPRTQMTNVKIIGNIVINGKPDISMVPSSAEIPLGIAPGIYLDERSKNVEVANNSVANTAHSGIFINSSAGYINVHDNTVYNASSYQYYSTYWGGTDVPPTNNQINNNVFISRLKDGPWNSSGQKDVFFYFSNNDAGALGPDLMKAANTLDNNYYARLIGDNDHKVIRYAHPQWDPGFLTLPEWQAYSGQDINSHLSSASATSESDIHFEYNATTSNKVISLSEPMIDVTGAKYATSVTLLPYTSIVLIKDTNPGPRTTPITFYVSSTGSDSNNGTTTSTPWQTIAKVNASTFIPGDQILFKKGDTWRETLTVPSSGNSGSDITFGSYGTGNKPRILGSEIETSWTNVSGNIWASTHTFTDPYAVSSYYSNIYFVETNGNISWGRIKKTNTSAFTSEYDWTWSSNKIYIYSPTNPNTRYSGVEITQRRIGILLNDKEHITIDGLEIAYSGNQGVAEGWPESNITGLIVKNCLIHHIGIKASGKAYGIESWHSNSLIQNNIIHDSGRRNISLNLYGDTAQVHDITIEDNTIYNGFHTTGVDISSQGASTLTNIIIRRNYIYNEMSSSIDNVENYGSAFIYAAKEGAGDVGEIYVYDNLFKNVTSNALAFGTTSGPSSVYIYNNTFYGVSAYITETYKSMVLIQKGSNVILKNNIFYNDVQVSLNSTFSLINITSDAGTVLLDNNLYYNTQATRNIAWYGTSYSVAQWTTYKSASGQDSHSILGQNPLFVSSSDFHLQSGSPAINAGVNVGLTGDYEGNSIVGFPDIGAYESNYTSDITPPSISSFTIPTTSSSLTVSISTFTATDVNGVTGYKLTESSSSPLAGDSGWTGSAPTTYTFATEGSKTLYAWAKDAAGNVSVSLIDSVTITIPTGGTTYYVATNGNDNNSGTIGSPWATWQKGFQTAVAGDTVYIRGGVYYATGILYGGNYYGVRIGGGHNGTALNHIKILAYPGEIPVLDGTNVVQDGVHFGVILDGVNYWDIKGLTVRNFKEYQSGGVYKLASSWSIVDSTYIYLENCTAHGNGAGFGIDGISDYIYYTNCDSYDNVDFVDQGGYSNGFSANINAGKHVFYYGCRSWLNSDDGFDFYGGDGYITVENSWAFLNGRYNGNGAGFKTGKSDGPKESGVQRTLINNLAWGNTTIGFDESQDNVYASTMEHYLYNNTSYNNGFGFNFGYAGSVSDTIRNNISFNDTSLGGMGTNIVDHNSWQNGLTVTSSDFISLDSTETNGSRQSDGSLPNLNFLKLVQGSDLINAGVDVGLLYNGSAPDIGAYESNYTSDITPPSISSFTIPTTSSSLTVSISTFTATDVNGVTGYKLTESSSSPLAGDSGWTGSAPTTYTFATEGSKTLYAWAKDAAGNVSTSVSDTVIVTLPVATYTLTINKSGTGAGNVTGAGTYNSGTVVTATSTPSTGSTFTSWAGDCNGSGQVTMTANKICTATFAINTYNISSSIGSNGSISPLGTTSKTYGSNQTYTITPSTGYHILDVLVDGVSQGTTNTYTFTNITTPHTISATFAVDIINTYTLTINKAGTGTGTVSGSTTYNSGTVVTATSTADSNSTFTSWSGDCNTSGVVTMTANKVCIATFTLTPVSSGGGGGGGGSSGGSGGSSSSSSSSVSTPVTSLITNTSPSILVSTASQPSAYVFTIKMTIGTKNNDVKELQKILIEKGYLTGVADGSFGPKTQTAVKKFQTANGLIPDGVIGQKGRDILNKVTTTLLVPVAPTTPNTILPQITKTVRFRSSLNDINEVKKLQQILINKGYLTGIADGIFGKGTLAAIVSFQKAHGLPSDGVVGLMTRVMLNRD